MQVNFENLGIFFPCFLKKMEIGWDGYFVQPPAC